MNHNNNATVAIVMPLGRLSPWFDEALNSALVQTFKVPIYLVANGLQPIEIMRLRELDDLHDQIQLFVFEERVEIFDNWNRVLNVLEESYFVMLHDDDILEPWAIEKLLGMMKEVPNQGIYFTCERIIDGNGRFCNNDNLKMSADTTILSKDEILQWAIGNRICATGFLLNREKAKKMGGYAADLPYTADWNLYFGVGAKYGACFSDIHCGRYRMGDNTGQATSALISNGNTLTEYKRQQRINLTLIGYQSYNVEKQIMQTLANFAKMSLNMYGECLSEEGKRVLKNTLVDAFIVKRMKWATHLLGTNLCRAVADKIISIKYSQL